MATQRDVSPRQLVKLREFSTQLAQRLKEAPNLPTEPTRLAIRIGVENYLVEMGLAAEIVSLPEHRSRALDQAVVPRAGECPRPTGRSRRSAAPDGT